LATQIARTDLTFEITATGKIDYINGRSHVLGSSVQMIGTPYDMQLA
jgi:hypothetical protein